MSAPTTVSPAHQLALLELQRTDTELDQARTRMQALRQDAEYQRPVSYTHLIAHETILPIA